jgi:hypothetical protein
MKKLFTLLFVFGAVATSFAQTRDEAKDIILGKKNKNESETNKPVDKPKDVLIIGGKKDDERPYPSGTSSEQQVRIDQVNREYDAKIQSIRNNPTLTEEEKGRAIAQLNKDRARKIREIRGDSRTNTGKSRKGHGHENEDDDDNGNDRSKAKGNNGNHYGWEKGKGNPHKNGGKPGKKG